MAVEGLEPGSMVDQDSISQRAIVFGFTHAPGSAA